MFVVHERSVELHDHARASHVTLDETRHRARARREGDCGDAGSFGDDDDGRDDAFAREYTLLQRADRRRDAETTHTLTNTRGESNCSCP
jgi:hypothetical protein